MCVGGAKEKKKGVEVEQSGTSCTVYGEMGKLGGEGIILLNSVLLIVA